MTSHPTAAADKEHPQPGGSDTGSTIGSVYEELEAESAAYGASLADGFDSKSAGRRGFRDMIRRTAGLWMIVRLEMWRKSHCQIWYEPHRLKYWSCIRGLTQAEHLQLSLLLWLIAQCHIHFALPGGTSATGSRLGGLPMGPSSSGECPAASELAAGWGAPSDEASCPSADCSHVVQFCLLYLRQGCMARA